jgi:dTDP-L-rhamnose 4-epimerase
VAETVLVTGGAGFIGTYVVRELLARGKSVRVLDSLIEQVHGASGERPARLPAEAELIIGDVRDEAAVEKAVDGVNAVIHLAAEVGVGQSMYAVERYVSVNDTGTALLFQKLIDKPVRRVVTASSMSIYGEGLYQAGDGAFIEDAKRAGKSGTSWDPVGPDGTPLVALPTPEWKRPSLASVYALTKYAQEVLTMTVAPAYGMEAVALRLFNVFGPGQALSNPYTGVLAIFASRFLNGQSPMIFEDGMQRRDFVHVEDVARAFAIALDHPDAPGNVYNIGSGVDRTVVEVAQLLAAAMGRNDLSAEIVGKARIGDIRHCFADCSKAAAELGFTAERRMEDELPALAEWVRQQEAVDRVAEARRELESRGLVA